MNNFAIISPPQLALRRDDHAALWNDFAVTSVHRRNKQRSWSLPSREQDQSRFLPDIQHKEAMKNLLLLSYYFCMPPHPTFGHREMFLLRVSVMAPHHFKPWSSNNHSRTHVRHSCQIRVEYGSTVRNTIRILSESAVIRQTEHKPTELAVNINCQNNCTTHEWLLQPPKAMQLEIHDTPNLSGVNLIYHPQQV